MPPSADLGWTGHPDLHWGASAPAGRRSLGTLSCEARTPPSVAYPPSPTEEFLPPGDGGRGEASSPLRTAQRSGAAEGRCSWDGTPSRKPWEPVVRIAGSVASPRPSLITRSRSEAPAPMSFGGAGFTGGSDSAPPHATSLGPLDWRVEPQAGARTPTLVGVHAHRGMDPLSSGLGPAVASVQRPLGVRNGEGAAPAVRAWSPAARRLWSPSGPSQALEARAELAEARGTAAEVVASPRSPRSVLGYTPGRSPTSPLPWSPTRPSASALFLPTQR